jgi:uncharacterized tellurite resistance protein B-like protein
MWKSLLAMVRDQNPINPAPMSVEMAGLALMLEISRADHNHSEVEQAEIVAAATRVLNLDSSTLTPLLTHAEAAVEHAVSFHEFTQVLNDALDRAAKCRLLEQLWRIAYADGALDRYEEHYLRKISDLLRLSHGDLIRTKLAVAPQ